MTDTHPRTRNEEWRVILAWLIAKFLFGFVLCLSAIDSRSFFHQFQNRRARIKKKEQAYIAALESGEVPPTPPPVRRFRLPPPPGFFRKVARALEGDVDSTEQIEPTIQFSEDVEDLHALDPPCEVSLLNCFKAFY